MTRRAVAATSPAPEHFQQLRAHACRLTPDRALRTLDDADAFLAARGMLTLTPSSALPSLFEACHEEPYRPGGHGFSSWPATRWWWGGALAARPGAHALKIHQGKRLFLSDATIALVDPLCRAELAKASQGGFGPAAQELVSFLEAAGASSLDDIKTELGIAPRALNALRDRLERVGAIVSRQLPIAPASASERETSELARWDQRYPDAPTTLGGLERLLVAAVRAAVIAPQHELARWFSWPLPPTLLDSLLETGQLQQPQPGWLTAPPPTTP
jgi:hypothetical protein